MFQLVTKSRGHYQFQGELTIQVADSLVQALTALLSGTDGPLRFDCSEVERLDTVGFQILFSFRLTMGPDRVRYEAFPDALQPLLQTSRFGKLLA